MIRNWKWIKLAWIPFVILFIPAIPFFVLLRLIVYPGGFTFREFIYDMRSLLNPF